MSLMKKVDKRRRLPSVNLMVAIFRNSGTNLIGQPSSKTRPSTELQAGPCSNLSNTTSTSKLTANLILPGVHIGRVVAGRRPL